MEKKYQEYIDCLKDSDSFDHSVEELLWLIWAIGFDYDGYSRAEDLKDIIDELVAYALYASELLREGKYFKKALDK